jgi:acyl-CoA thioesterase FadM
MLGYLFRTLPAVARALAARDGATVSRVRRRVSLREIDLNGHMNQARYAEVLELGRLDWILRSGAWRRWRGAGFNPVVAEQRLVYRRELAPLQPYAIDSRAVAVDGRLLRMEQLLLVGDRVHTRGEVALLFVGPEGVAAPERAEELCQGLLAEPLPVEGWRVAGG